MDACLVVRKKASYSTIVRFIPIIVSIISCIIYLHVSSTLSAQCTFSTRCGIICFNHHSHSNLESHQYVKLKSNNNFTSNLSGQRKKVVNFMNTSLLFYYRIQMCFPLHRYTKQTLYGWFTILMSQLTSPSIFTKRLNNILSFFLLST